MRNLLWPLLGLLALTHAAMAQPIDWKESGNEALAEALAEGKLILLVAGRTNCVNCIYMREEVCEDPTVRPTLDENYVMWFSDVDASSAWVQYATGLGPIPLPMICVIEPGDPGGYLDRTTSWTYPSNFLARVTARLPSLSPEVTDLTFDAGGFSLDFAADTGALYRVLVSNRDLGLWGVATDRIAAPIPQAEVPFSTDADDGWLRIIGFRPDTP